MAISAWREVTHNVKLWSEKEEMIPRSTHIVFSLDKWNLIFVSLQQRQKSLLKVLRMPPFPIIIYGLFCESLARI